MTELEELAVEQAIKYYESIPAKITGPVDETMYFIAFMNGATESIDRACSVVRCGASKKTPTIEIVSRLRMISERSPKAKKETCPHVGSIELLGSNPATGEWFLQCSKCKSLSMTDQTLKEAYVKQLTIGPSKPA